MNKATIEHCIVDILEYGISDIGIDHGRIKRWAIENLSEAVKHISKDAVLTPVEADRQKQCDHNSWYERINGDICCRHCGENLSAT